MQQSYGTRSRTNAAHRGSSLLAAAELDAEPSMQTCRKLTDVWAPLMMCSARYSMCVLTPPGGKQLDPAAVGGVTGGLHGFRCSCSQRASLAARHLRPP